MFSEREPENPVDKYAVCVKKEDKVVGHLPLEEKRKFAKSVFNFLRVDAFSSYKVIITGKPVNLGDGYGIQVPCKLMFVGVERCINILQENLQH